MGVTRVREHHLVRKIALLSRVAGVLLGWKRKYLQLQEVIWTDCN
jgi:hypothetical protein